MAAKRLKVKDEPNLERDSHSKAVVNIDRSQYLQHRSRKKRLLAEKERMKSLEERIAILEKHLLNTGNANQ